MDRQGTQEKIKAGKIHDETLDGAFHVLNFNFMLIPPISGVGLKVYNKAFRTQLSQLLDRPSSHICQCCRQSPAWT